LITNVSPLGLDDCLFLFLITFDRSPGLLMMPRSLEFAKPLTASISSTSLVAQTTQIFSAPAAHRIETNSAVES